MDNWGNCGVEMNLDGTNEPVWFFSHKDGGVENRIETNK